LKKQNIKYSL